MTPPKTQLQQILPFWDKLKEAEKELISNNCRFERFQKGNIINRTDEGCRGAIVLRSGRFEFILFLMKAEKLRFIDFM